ncbi:MAG TPA: DUF6765 family protein, partial [Chitinispirillaceae bacterium]|nr:DUF6765 family protein [Chitinispirillaceae bacterium]
TFADTWAHRGFSGRHDSENNVSTIKIKKKSKFRCELIKNIYLDLLPQIGHCEAGYCPDIPYLHWKCKINNRQHESNNAVSFLDAAEKIYQRLSRIKKQTAVKSWESLAKDFTTLFACDEENIDKRCANWQKRFGALFPDGSYQYSPNFWRKKAFGVTDEKDVEWDKYSMDKMSKLRYAGSPSFSESDWVKFHKAARMQRAEVIT